MNLGMKLSGLALSLAFSGAVLAQNAPQEPPKDLRTQEGELAAQCSAVFGVMRHIEQKKHKADPVKNPKDGSENDTTINRFDNYARKRIPEDKREKVYFDYTSKWMTLGVQADWAVENGDMNLLNRVYARKMADVNTCNDFMMKQVMLDLIRK